MEWMEWHNDVLAARHELRSRPGKMEVIRVMVCTLGFGETSNALGS